MVNKGNHPQMALFQVSEILFHLPRYGGFWYYTPTPVKFDPNACQECVCFHLCHEFQAVFKGRAAKKTNILGGSSHLVSGL